MGINEAHACDVLATLLQCVGGFTMFSGACDLVQAATLRRAPVYQDVQRIPRDAAGCLIKVEGLLQGTPLIECSHSGARAVMCEQRLEYMYAMLNGSIASRRVERKVQICDQVYVTTGPDYKLRLELRPRWVDTESLHSTYRQCQPVRTTSHRKSLVALWLFGSRVPFEACETEYILPSNEPVLAVGIYQPDGSLTNPEWWQVWQTSSLTSPTNNLETYLQNRGVLKTIVGLFSWLSSKYLHPSR